MGQGLSGRVDVTRLSADALVDLLKTTIQLSDVYQAASDRHFLRGDCDRTLLRLYARERADTERLMERAGKEVGKRVAQNVFVRSA